MLGRSGETSGGVRRGKGKEGGEGEEPYRTVVGGGLFSVAAVEPTHCYDVCRRVKEVKWMRGGAGSERKGGIDGSVDIYTFAGSIQTDPDRPRSQVTPICAHSANVLKPREP